ncbi:potassium-transporting ATPase subunit KdpC [Paenibacillus sp. UMB4589-SE434]|uniref:potassium-transporting ATPase subunit KdpC n=1 Tax=Paenibacillus sp. UMB4589-SE434 TaxID=3046314 RepID=UPI002551533F|nr:potassium-transporting ATPase subunit KdpC [Paenibacillus sp. UMB4589-SE434]MDK8183654.1 potassium-transporting ATPase subunit KdpC [Paenibacillus sp. UMB4589-SE434]
MSSHLQQSDHTDSPADNGGGISTIIRTSVGLLVLCGLIYPLLMTGIAQAILPKEANGSLIYNAKGQAIGSELIGQTFTEPQYFHGRVSSIDYNGVGAGSPNFAPSNPDLKARVEQFAADWSKNNPEVPLSKVPADLVTNSGSGLDPHISPEAAQAQLPRVAKAAGLSLEEVQHLVDKYTESADLGIFGEPRVNVLLLNLAVQGEMKGDTVRIEG